jgi:tRNA pseudouridine38-40 synthase
MAGTLKLVGLGRWQPDDVARALATRDRRAGGPTAPPEGLYLVEVRYLTTPQVETSLRIVGNS